MRRDRKQRRIDADKKRAGIAARYGDAIRARIEGTGKVSREALIKAFSEAEREVLEGSAPQDREIHREAIRSFTKKFMDELNQHLAEKGEPKT